MKTLIIAVALVGAISAAHADWHYETTYRDLVRPNGQPRSEAAYQADLDFCSSETHVTSKLAADTAESRADEELTVGKGFAAFVADFARLAYFAVGEF